MGSMVIAVLEMMLPRGNEAVTVGALRAFWDATCARPGGVGGVFQEVGRPETALYTEMWEEARSDPGHGVAPRRHLSDGLGPALSGRGSGSSGDGRPVLDRPHAG